MHFERRGAWGRVNKQTRRPLVLGLLAMLLFEVSLLAGVLASPFVQDWLPHRGPQMDDTNAMLVRYRRSLFHRELDPRVGEPAPPLALKTAAGQALSAAVYRNKKVALLFARDGAG